MKDAAQDGTQLELGIANTSAPKQGIRSGQLVVDRSKCPTERPCRMYSCRHNLHVDDERAGRPHGGVSPPPKLDRTGQSCSLDVAEDGEHSVEQTAKHMHVTPRRVLQLENRALAKMGVARALEDWMSELVLKLPPGTRIEAVYPEQLDANRTVIALVVRVDGEAWRVGVEQSGVTVRRKRKPSV